MTGQRRIPNAVAGMADRQQGRNGRRAGPVAGEDHPAGQEHPARTRHGGLVQTRRAGAYKLVVSLPGTPAKNEWNFWLYPAQVSASVPTDVLVTHSWDEAQARLATGGKVLFLPNQADMDWNSPPLDKVPIFWDRQMGPKWSRMLGVWCDTKHPALAGFPTDVNYDWQWTDVIAPPACPGRAGIQPGPPAARTSAHRAAD